MAPTKPTSKGKGGPKGKSGGSSKPKPTGKQPEGISKRKQKSMKLAKPGGAQKTKSKVNDGRKKKRTYTEAELDIPKLNSIIPAGVAKPKGQKKGKVFVDDPASMMAIMSVVNAQKEGHIESKIMRSRQLEEIREAKRKEAEARADKKKEDFEETKQSLKKQKTQRKKAKHAEPLKRADAEAAEKTAPKSKKRVSFG